MYYWHGPNFFWLFVLAIIVVSIIARVIRSHQRERTIRMAIEKGVALDPSALSSLQRGASNPQDTRTGLLTGSIVTFFVGCGLMAMGYVLGLDGVHHSPHPLIAVGVLLWCISAGLFVSRLAIGRSS